jgi:hypothetical protein
VPQTIDADLVMMSKASNEHLAVMTQRAINTAKYGALPRVCNVIVMEQTARQYTNATTVLAPGTFNYNAFANGGAKLGTAPWIVFANNDLQFKDGWLDAMLKRGHNVMSPYNPYYYRHANLLSDIEIGDEVGRHLSGWCFMMRRDLCEALGGLDETYPFWCADNAVMDQLREEGLQAVLVRDSVVLHDVSATLFTEPPDVQCELTWEAVGRYNEAHPENKTSELDRRYALWRRGQGL